MESGGLRLIIIPFNPSWRGASESIVRGCPGAKSITFFQPIYWGSHYQKSQFDTKETGDKYQILESLNGIFQLKKKNASEELGEHRTPLNLVVLKRTLSIRKAERNALVMRYLS